jgi:phage terminase small subunit
MTDPRHIKFAEAYVIDRDPSAAARAAGFAAAAAAATGKRLLQNPAVQAHIALLEKKLERVDDLVITRERIMTEYAKIAFANVADAYDSEGHLLPPHQIPAAVIQAAKEYTPGEKIKLHDKTAALTALGKALGWFTDLNEARQALAKYGFEESRTETGGFLFEMPAEEA